MIVRISCKDFLTYSSVECYPCAKLNMIVGPNGTGKSSLVSAIVLGLGGKTNIIGRAKQLSAYVKNDCTTATVEIELYSEPSNYTIGREFNLDNKSSWTINGQIVAYREVEKKIKEMNIQVDNLCQFLPQDRVEDFAKMNSKELLENTLKTVGSKEIVDLHEKLKELREEETSLDSRTKVLRQNLESEKKKISRLENEVQAIQERQEMMKRVEMLEKKKAWVEVGEKEEKKKKVQEDRKKIMGIKKEAEERLVPFKKQIEKTKEAKMKIQKEIDKEAALCANSLRAGGHHLVAVEKAEEKIASTQMDLKKKLDFIVKKAEKVNRMEEEIKNLETHAQPEKEARLQQQMTEIQPLLAEKSTATQMLQAKIEEEEKKMEETVRTKNKLQGKLDREMSAANKKLQILQQRFPDTFKAYQWLQNNRHLFENHIYGPIMLEINCNEDVAKFVEFTIPHRELIMFVCEDKNDMNKLLRMVRDGTDLENQREGGSRRSGLKINAAMATRNFQRPVNENYRPNLNLQDIRQYGFWDYVINQIDGPNAVLNYLCHNLGLHQIPLGNNQTSTMMDKIPSQIRSYFSDTQHISVRQSKYTGVRSSRMVDVNRSNLLAASINTTAIAEYKKSIQNEEQKLNGLRTNCEKLKSKLSTIEREMNNFRHQKRELDQELTKLKTGRNRLSMLKRELKHYIEGENIDPEEEKAKAKADIREVILGLPSEHRHVITQLQHSQNSLLHYLKNKQKQSIYQNIQTMQEKESAEALKKVDDANNMLVNVEQELRTVTRTWEKVKAKALEMTDGLSPGDARFRRKYDEEFAGLPEDEEGLEREISEVTARVEIMAGGRESVVEEYKKTKKTIEDLEKAVANPEQQLANLKHSMHSKRDQWLPQVQHLIERITKNFTAFFCHINCVGEVSLEIPPDEDDYAQYGICIRVQFREDSRLQQLDSRTQSGGERAISTAIYMLSLQELTTVPFRCVDEINQGMDEYNERVVFKLMVNTVEKANSAQCFLLTPKLLHKLEYSENVRVLCIYSGPGSISHLQFKVDKYLKKMRRYSDKIQRESLKRKHVESDDSD